MRAAVYVRISRDRRVTADDGTQRMTMLGVERQEEDCRGLAATLGWDVAEVFVDNDVSAMSGKPRPAYRRMLQAIKDGHVDAIVCWHPDRLYRKTVDLEELVAVCDKNRVPVATVNAGHVDLTTPTGRLVAGLLAQVAKYEGEHKAERWKRSWVQRRTAGNQTACGWRTFGWDRDGNLIPQEAELVRWMAREVTNGAALSWIARQMTALGVPTTMGNTEWNITTIRKLLVNPRLAGWVAIRGQVVSKESSWPPILSEEEFEAVRSIIRARSGRVSRPRVATLLGLSRCGVCATNLITSTRSPASTKGKPKRIYKCPEYHVSIAAEPLEQLVESYARGRLDDARVRQTIRSLQAGDEKSKDAYEMARLEARLVELQGALGDPDSPVQEVLRAMEGVRTRMSELEGALATYNHVSLPEPNAEWPSDVTRRNALCAVVVDHVMIDPLPGPSRGNQYFNPERVRVIPK